MAHVYCKILLAGTLENILVHFLRSYINYMPYAISQSVLRGHKLALEMHYACPHHPKTSIFQSNLNGSTTSDINLTFLGWLPLHLDTSVTYTQIHMRVLSPDLTHNH